MNNITPSMMAKTSPKVEGDAKPVVQVAVPKPKKPNDPVRNPAFREHEGLKELQRELHRNVRNQK